MYVDSTNETEPSGEMPVSRLMIQHIEPLLQVRNSLASYYSLVHRPLPCFQYSYTENVGVAWG